MIRLCKDVVDLFEEAQPLIWRSRQRIQLWHMIQSGPMLHLWTKHYPIKKLTRRGTKIEIGGNKVRINKVFIKYIFCWRAPFGNLYFLYFKMNQNWVQKSILAWLWHHFHLVQWMRQDSNPQPIDREPNSLPTTRPD